MFRRHCAGRRGAGGALVVTADHGNCEKMFEQETQQPHTAHTLNKVPSSWLTCRTAWRGRKQRAHRDAHSKRQARRPCANCASTAWCGTAEEMTGEALQIDEEAFCKGKISLQAAPADATPREGSEEAEAWPRCSSVACACVCARVCVHACARASNAARCATYNVRSGCSTASAYYKSLLILVLSHVAFGGNCVTLSDSRGLGSVRTPPRMSRYERSSPAAAAFPMATMTATAPRAVTAVSALFVSRAQSAPNAATAFFLSATAFAIAALATVAAAGRCSDLTSSSIPSPTFGLSPF